jgi:proton-dependent oligopeptide transporter, POT family
MISGIKKRQFGLIFFVELWERWAFYGFQSLFILFITYKHLDETQAYLMFGVFAALLYLTPTIGGYIADKYLGIKRALIIGGLLMLAGYIFLSFAQSMNQTVLALSFIIVGNGLFKPTPSALVSKIFNDNPTVSHSAFTLYYMAINIGSFFGIAITPMVAMYTSFSLSFLISVIGMVIALTNFAWRYSILKDVNGEKDLIPITFKVVFWTLFISAIQIALCYLLFKITDISFYLIIALCIIAVFYMLFDALKVKNYKEKVMQIIGIFLVIEAVIYFIVYNQMFSTLTLFAKHNMNLDLFGITVTPATFAALDALWLIALSPIFAKLYMSMNKRNIHLEIPFKYAIGTAISGIAFIVLVLVIKTTAIDGMISGNWMILYYFFAATAELLIAALGMSLISLYFREEVVTIGMGFFMLALAAGGALAGKLGEFVAMPSTKLAATSSLPIYTVYFEWVGAICLFLGVIYFIIAIILRRWARKNDILLG